jgi:regulator of protease activity HflC (stomatin/prohibitin superfamily)
VFDKLIDLFVSFLHLFQFCFVVRSYQAGVVLRYGRMHRRVAPGFHWIWPFHVEEHITVSVVRETVIVGPQSLTTKDGVSIIVSTLVTFSINDAETFLLKNEGAHTVLEDSTCGTVSDFVLNRTWIQLQDSTDVSNELAKAIRRRAKPQGVEILDAHLVDFTRSRSFRIMQQFNHRSHGGN